MSKFNRERKERQRSAFGPPPPPQMRKQIGGSMTQVQCHGCKATFPHEAALREHWRTDVVCAQNRPMTATEAAQKTAPIQWMPMPKLHDFQQEFMGHMLGRIDRAQGRGVERLTAEQQVEMLARTVDNLKRDLRTRDEDFRRAIQAADTKIAALEKQLQTVSLEPRFERAMRGKIDYTEWRDEEDNLTDETRGIPPTKQKITF